MTTLTINGEERSVEPAETVGQLLDTLGLGQRRVAVMVDDQIVRQEQREQTPLTKGQRIEIIQMVGGG
jgi:sulfur carrier protein